MRLAHPLRTAGPGNSFLPRKLFYHQRFSKADQRPVPHPENARHAFSVGDGSSGSGRVGHARAEHSFEQRKSHGAVSPSRKRVGIPSGIADVPHRLETLAGFEIIFSFFG